MVERRLSVMISSTSELRKHCEAVSKIAESAGFATKCMKFPSASEETPIDASRKMIEEARRSTLRKNTSLELYRILG